MVAPANRDFRTEVRIEVNKLKMLPPVPAELQRLLLLIRDEQLTLDQLYEAVSSSPALAARLLGLANSAYFGQSGQVKTIRQAVYQVLGLSMVKSLVYAQMATQTLDTSRCEAFRDDRFWTVSLLTAVFAQRLADHLPVRALVEPGLAYTGGLLINLGLLALVHTFPAEMDAIFRMAEQRGTGVFSHLRQGYGVDQYRVGGWLARRWHFPPAVSDLMLALAGQPAGAAEPLALIVLLGNTLARHCYRGERDYSTYVADANRLGLSEGQLARLVETVNAEKQGLADTARRLGRPS